MSPETVAKVVAIVSAAPDGLRQNTIAYRAGVTPTTVRMLKRLGVLRLVRRERQIGGHWIRKELWEPVYKLVPNV